MPRLTRPVKLVLTLCLIAGCSTITEQFDRPDSTKQPVTLPTSAFVAKGLNVRGFLLGRYLDSQSPEAVREVYEQVAREILDGVIQAPVDSLYPIEEIKAAVTHAQAAGRNGKILIAPNGPLG